MEPGTPAGIAARIEIAERQQSETFTRLRTIELRQAEIHADVRNTREDMAEVKVGLASCADNCQAIRTWVDQRLKDEGERRRLSRGELLTFAAVAIAFLGAVFTVLSTLGAIG